MRWYKFNIYYNNDDMRTTKIQSTSADEAMKTLVENRIGEPIIKIVLWGICEDGFNRNLLFESITMWRA